MQLVTCVCCLLSGQSKEYDIHMTFIFHRKGSTLTDINNRGLLNHWIINIFGSKYELVLCPVLSAVFNIAYC